MSAALLQEQVELNLEYSEGSLRKWQTFLVRRLLDFLKSKNPVSEHTGLTPAFNLPGDRVTVLPRGRNEMVKRPQLRNDEGVLTAYTGAYARQYVPQSVRGGEAGKRAGNGGAGGSYSGGGSSGRS